MFTFDGRSLKSVSPTAWTNDAYFPGSMDDGTGIGIAGNLTSAAAYKYVAYLYRAIVLRCSLISHIPYGLYNIKSDKEINDPTPYLSITSNLRNLWYMAEGSACIYGAAYWLVESNLYGRNITPRWVTTKSVKPIVDREKGLTGFERNHKPIALEDIIYFWEPNFESETAPGSGCAQVALGAAGMLYALDAFATALANRGGVGVTVFELPPSMPTTDKDKFQEWINRRVSGVMNAFRMLAVRGGIKATTIGSSIKDTQAKELTDAKRQDVAVATGIPVSVIDGRSSDVSNSRSEKVGMYTDMIFPRAEFLFDIANRQLFHRLGIEVRPKLEELEVMQDIQLAQAQAVAKLIPGQRIISLNEARDIIGKERSKDPEADKIGPVIIYRQMATSVTSPTPPTEDKVPGPDQEQVTKALGEWRRTARASIKSGGVFVLPAAPNIIPDELAVRINAALTSCKTVSEVNVAFETCWPKKNISTTDRQPWSKPTATDVIAELRATRTALEQATKALVDNA